MSFLQMSVTGGIMAAVIALLRCFFKNRLPRRTFILLWWLVVLRLLLPFSLPSSLSVYSLLSRDTAATETIQNTPVAQLLPLAPSARITDAPSSNVGLAWDMSVTASTEVNSYLLPIWLAGALVCGSFFVLSFWYYRRKFSAFLPIEEPFIQEWLALHPLRRPLRVRSCDFITTPLTYGILRPVILLPSKTDWSHTIQLKYVLQHEYIHIRRFDALTKLVVATTLCLHWFNPLVWQLYLLFNRDIERSCDEAVVRSFAEDVRATYAYALIHMEETRLTPVPLYNHFGKNAIEERIRSIMKIKKPSILVIALASILIIGVAFVFATSAAKSSGAKTFWGLFDMVDVTVDDASAVIDEENVAASALVDEESINTGEQLTVTAAEQYAEAEAQLKLEEQLAAAELAKLEEEKAKLQAELAIANKELFSNENASQDGYSTVPNTSAQPDVRSFTTQLHYMKEGMESTIQAELHVGDGYSIYIPSDEWTLYAPDAWKAKVNDAVQFRVTKWENTSANQVLETLKPDGYALAEGSSSLLEFSDTANDLLRFVQLGTSGDDIWGVFYCYPTEAIEGWGASLPVIVSTFAVTELGADAQVIEAMVKDFADCYFAGDVNGLKTCLSSAFAENLITVDNSTPAYTKIKGLENVGECSVGDSCVISVEYKGDAIWDYYEYLTLDLIKEENGWKVQDYWIEL